MAELADAPLDTGPTTANSTLAILLLSLIIIGWIGFLFFESTRPPSHFLGLIPHLDKVAHFGAFSILGMLASGLSLKLHSKPRIPIFSMPLMVVTLCGALEECLQMVVPGRVASPWDLLADICGGLFAIMLVNRLRTIQKWLSAVKGFWKKSLALSNSKQQELFQ